ncbi:DUF998 domain-containing protein [Streptomyces showdoensis]|uniref:DUF998 domain-containing protein n=1 Tax=Streptomyces showdoensis TaxID=68268 RepID=UPI000F4EDF97|nr:DUF998 domain-containing protein [Streptomyces showdoensis]
MPATLTARPDTDTPRAARPARRGPVLGLVVAGPLFLAAGVAQGLSRDGFDFTRNAFSQLALGDAGWVQTVNFLVTGALLLVGAAGLRRTAGGTWGPVLVGVFALSFWAAALFPADAGAGFPAGAPDATTMSGHGAAHMAAGMVGYLALCAAFPVLARPLAARGHRGWALAARLAPAAVLAGFLASAASVLAFTVAAGGGLCFLAAATARLATGTAKAADTATGTATGTVGGTVSATARVAPTR